MALQTSTKGWLGGLAAAAALFFGIGRGTKPSAPAPPATPPPAATCPTVASDARALWHLAVYNKACVDGKKLPSGHVYGDPYRCRQSFVNYPDLPPNPHGADQPKTCWPANVDPSRGVKIAFNGTDFYAAGAATSAEIAAVPATGAPTGAPENPTIGECYVTAGGTSYRYGSTGWIMALGGCK